MKKAAIRQPFVDLEVILLLSDTESCNKGSVSFDIDGSKIVEETSSLTNHHQKSSSAVVITLVSLEVFCEVIDPVRKDSDLNLRRTCIAFCDLILFDDCLLVDSS